MNDLRIKTSVLGAVATNCYLVYHAETKAAVVIDPADNSDYIIKMCRDMGLTVEAVLLTHGHFDHILAAEAVKNGCNCPVYANRDEIELLQNPAVNLGSVYGMPQLKLTPDRQLKDGEEFSLIGFTWKMIATPGHTGGSACYYVESEGVLFSGDTLFLESLGRTDMPTGNSAQIVQSIQEKLLVLPEDTMVYPGHSDPTTIAHEQQCNPVAVYRR